MKFPVGQLATLFSFWLLVGCANFDDDVSTDPGIRLTFSADTVLFDTLITERLSITRRFRVFNTSNADINIDEIFLATGEESSYELVIQGLGNKSFSDQLLRDNDSLLVLVTANIDMRDESLPFLVKDSIIFRWNGNQEDIKLIAYGQDANFRGNEVICDETWTAGKPYVLTEDILIDSLCTLTIEPGTKIYADNGVSIFVQGNLLVRGDSGQNRVVFRNTRFDPAFLQAPGQWGGLVFFPGSTANTISHCTLENAETGIFCFGTNEESAQVSINMDHAIIRHMSISGIQAFSSNISISNSLVHNCGSFLFSAFVGGQYELDHCTMSNDPNFFIRNEPSFVALDNFPDDPGLVQRLRLSVENSIIWGNENEELLLDNGGGTMLDTLFRNNIIKSDGQIPGNLTSSERNFPGFIDANIDGFDYRLDSLSVAIDAAIGSTAVDDLNGFPRDENPDIGAFERPKEN